MHHRQLLLFIFQVFILSALVFGQDAPKQEDYYKVVPIPVPEGVVLEAGGLDFMPNGKLAVSTRRGDIYMVSNALDEAANNETFPCGHADFMKCWAWPMRTDGFMQRSVLR